MARPHIAARLEDIVRRRIGARLKRRGWHERVTGFSGYGSEERARVFARIVLSRHEPEEARKALTHAQDTLLDIAQRGYRYFLTAPASGVRVQIQLGQARMTAVSDRGGYIDTEIIGHGLPPGWHEAQIGLGNGDTLSVSVLVVSSDVRVGLVSDIDDTVMVTHLPRILIAGWNTFVRSELGREQVPGMGALYRSLCAENPGMPVFYLSTGAWNTAPALTRFLRRHDYPVGPLLLTDWGPTNTGWFRSGQEHKESELRRLHEEFPRIRWILVGDDGQHDPVIYGEFVEEHPDAVDAVAIRELTPAEQLLSSGLPVATDELFGKRVATPMLKAPNGFGLHQLLHGAGLVGRRTSQVALEESLAGRSTEQPAAVPVAQQAGERSSGPHPLGQSPAGSAGHHLPDQPSFEQSQSQSPAGSTGRHLPDQPSPQRPRQERWRGA